MNPWISAVDALARGWLISIAFLLGCTLLPGFLGWRPHVVLTGSMSPHLRAGDVVVVDPAARLVTNGSIIVVRDAGAPSGHVVHRVTGMDADGRLITKGDANSSADSTHRSRADVIGQARLVVPGVGRIPLIREGLADRVDWLWFTVTVLAGLRLVMARSTSGASAASPGQVGDVSAGAVSTPLAVWRPEPENHDSAAHAAAVEV